MAEVVELVPRGAIDRVGEARKKKARGFRLMALAKAQKASEAEAIEAEADEKRKKVPGPEEDITQATLTTQRTQAQVTEVEAATGAPVEANPELAGPRAAEECLEVFQVGEECVVVGWRLEKLEEWGAPILGAACKEVLGKKRIRKVVFDFSDVEEMSTAAISTLVRFRNTIVHLDKSMCLVAGRRLRSQLAQAYVDRMIDLVDSLARVVGTEVRFDERPVVRERRRWWRFFFVAILALQLCSHAEADSRGDFPGLTELERMLPEAPELEGIRLEIEKLRLGASWTKYVNLHTSYSQHFASYVPVLSDSERKVSGDTFVLGVSASVSIDELVHGRKAGRLELELKELEYRRLYQAKLAALRVLYGNRAKLVDQLKALEAQAKTAGLKLERVKAGLEFEFLDFNPIDLAEAEEAVARIEVELRQAEIDIQATETRMFEILGKGETAP